MIPQHVRAAPTLFLSRHGETLWNRERRFQGQHDSPLTERGVEQARRMGRLLRATLGRASGWGLMSSPLGRAHRTAQLIAAELGLPASRIALDPRLMELNLGCWEGLTFAEIDALAPGGLADCPSSEIFFRCPDGESYDEFGSRLASWAADHARRERLIVVAHGLVGRLLRGHYAGLDRAATLDLPIPQDAIFKLCGGRIERLDCDAAPVEQSA